MRASISVYGGYDWDLGFNYVKAGFSVTNADMNVAFEVFAGDGYSASFKKGLSKIEPVSIGVPHFLDVGLTVSLEASASFDLATGGMNIADLGARYQQQDEMGFELNFIAGTANHWGWHDLQPKFLYPSIQNIPSALKFQASFGPAFGAKIDALGTTMTLSHCEGR